MNAEKRDIKADYPLSVWGFDGSEAVQIQATTGTGYPGCAVATLTFTPEQGLEAAAYLIEFANAAISRRQQTETAAVAVEVKEAA